MHLIRRRNERIYQLCEKSYVACTFQVQKFRSDGTITYQGPVFSNLILDVGLDSLSYRPLGLGAGSGTYINVGTDNTAPSTAQTGLLGFLASTYNGYSSSSGYSLTSPTYKWQEEIFEFAIGSCTGNLTEVGLSAASNSDYFNRQLFKDGVGDTTTITVQSDEGLRITTRAYFYPDLDAGGTETGSFLLNGATTYNYTREMTTASGWASNTDYGNVAYFGVTDRTMARLSDAAPAWTGNAVYADSVSLKTYTTGDYYRDFEIVCNAGTFVGDLAAVRFDLGIRNESGDHEAFTSFNLDTKITVEDTEEMKFTLRRAWGRYAA